jgi:hypothetical protein
MNNSHLYIRHMLRIILRWFKITMIVTPTHNILQGICRTMTCGASTKQLWYALGTSIAVSEITLVLKHKFLQRYQKSCIKGNAVAFIQQFSLNTLAALHGFFGEQWICTANWENGESSFDITETGC